MQAVIIFAVIIASFTLCNALSCPLDLNGKPYCTNVNPRICRYGTELDNCGQCTVCLKGPGEQCGGIWNTEGTCAKGYICQPNPKNWQLPGKCIKK
ncbi:hypothetical protein CHUAL_009958 [Chamberlinius hualienensis]